MLLNASLRKASYNVVMHEIKIKEMFKNIKKKRTKTLIKVNKNIYSKIIIKKSNNLQRIINKKKNFANNMRCQRENSKQAN